MVICFWLCIIVIFYTFFGYGIILYFLVLLKRFFRPRGNEYLHYEDLPRCSLIVAAYNEQELIIQKIENTLALKYPEGRLEIIFVTDGSSDRTPDLIADYPQIKLMHSPERRGKISAVHRAIKEVSADVIVFTDANTFLNENALMFICRHYGDFKVGAVAGEKRVRIDSEADATAGEGFYWKYESKLKQWDSELYSVVGAAGELFSIRRALYEPVSQNSILDDFMISMKIAEKGYVIKYEPEAFAQEDASANIKEELKRKVRIAAGGIQSVIWLTSILNPFRFPMLSFQYVSHRVLRWTLTPFLLLICLFLNLFLMVRTEGFIYWVTGAAQLLFYISAYVGRVLEERKLRVKMLFIPYYFCVMNYAVLAGIFRYFYGTQSVIWEKALRK